LISEDPVKQRGFQSNREKKKNAIRPAPEEKPETDKGSKQVGEKHF